jgi:putative NADH-flavin reductase
MHVLIIGASKGIGLETTRQALEAGHHVRALARSATGMSLSDPSLEKVHGDALKAQDVETALSGVEVVIQTLGVGLGDLFRPVHLFSDATRVLIAAMTAQGVKRLICLTGFGAGDSRASINCLQRLPFQIVFGRAYEDKSLQERLIKARTLQDPFRGNSVAERDHLAVGRRRIPCSTDRGADLLSSSSRFGQLIVRFRRSPWSQSFRNRPCILMDRVPCVGRRSDIIAAKIKPVPFVLSTSLNLPP